MAEIVVINAVAYRIAFREGDKLGCWFNVSKGTISVDVSPKHGCLNATRIYQAENYPTIIGSEFVEVTDNLRDECLDAVRVYLGEHPEHPELLGAVEASLA